MKNVRKISLNVLLVAGVIGLGACAQNSVVQPDTNYMVETPTVDYVESLDVYSAPHKDSFLNQLAMNYRSYAIYNARTSGYSEMGELFANKAVSAFSGDVPFPESLDNWPVDDEQASFELHNAYNELIDSFKNDATILQPELAAEAQAKYDCWLSALASGQYATANECRDRFQKTMTALRDCTGGKVVKKKTEQVVETVQKKQQERQYYPDTRNVMQVTSQPREGVVIVNNVNIPEHLINPVPVQPMVFNQNIYADDNHVTNAETPEMLMVEETQQVSGDWVSRQEFVDMMMTMRAELAAINARLDELQASAGEKTLIKVQQIPLEPKQHVMEEVFEVRFDFDKSVIKPEYQELIQQLVAATQDNRNIKVSVVGHTDTAGSRDYNYALGGRRAEAVQKMLIQYGIPASQIVAVSAGEEDLAVPTPDNTPNAANRRVRVVKEVHYTEDVPASPMAIAVEEVEIGECGEYGCAQ
jgi:peptidoglycan-associated lipoprotein